ncbi:MAG: glucosamine-6-phosphate deaminase [Planctomycetota bacterium]|nr:MAG: glucosamine-6-phosphate deaminase [Planctomycetota bacterium]
MPAAEPAQLLQRERIRTLVFPDTAEASAAVAHRIAERIRQRQQRGERCVLGLPTGSTPTEVYAELVRLHREEGLSFRNVVTFNLDEYYPISPESPQSYVRYMREHLFDHVDIPASQVHIPDGTVPIERVLEHCQEYERAIAQAGGLDLVLLGIGRTGHIGFNEPGSSPSSRTRLITLDRVTRLDAAGEFFGFKNVPRRAITMGVGTILEARQVVLMALGEHKARIVAQAVEGPVSAGVPASYLQQHPDATVVLDRAAAGELTRFKTPWLVAPVLHWDERMIRRAVIWLARRLHKPILKLTDEDYNEAGLQDLLAARGPAYDINVDVFRGLQVSINGWPGGKPASQRRPGDVHRPTDRIFPKRVLIFSPHPDDDVISMGGTLIRLVEHGHEVHVAYQVSGSIAVSDDTALRFAEFAGELNQRFDLGGERTAELVARVRAALANKAPGEPDPPEVRVIKAMIRRSEARAAARACGLALERVHFLDLPFYETGRARKRPLGEEDIRIVAELLERVRPHQVYAAGDLSDPHGTHRTCLLAIRRALQQLEHAPWRADCELWLYRGAWEEWEPERIDMAVPLSPEELLRKRAAIFKHESQRGEVMFPGADPREFWQRAEDRNRNTARLYDALGLADYEAIEGFVRWQPGEPEGVP